METVLFIDQFMGTPADGLQHLCRGEIVGAAPAEARPLLLLQTGNTDFKKLIKIGGGDAEIFNALQKRNRLVPGLFQYPPVKFQQAEFPVNVEVGAVECVCFHFHYVEYETAIIHWRCDSMMTAALGRFEDMLSGKELAIYLIGTVDSMIIEEIKQNVALQPG